jgi:hypothetical protein
MAIPALPLSCVPRKISEADTFPEAGVEVKAMEL